MSMKTDSLLTSSCKLPYHPVNESMATSLTDVTSLSILQMNIKQTCSCPTCTCSNDSISYHNKIKSDYFENTDDCLTYAFITLYESSVWCMQMIHELFFKSFWQILMYVKQELQHNQSDNKTIKREDMISINKSTSKNYPLMYNRRECPELSEVRNRRKYHTNKTHRVISNQNTNQISSKEKNSSIIDTHIVLIPVRSSYCQTELWKNDLQTINIDLNQSEKNKTDTFCRRLDEPLIFMNREIYCRYNRTTFCSTIPSECDHSRQNLLQQQSNSNREFSPYKNSPINERANKITSILSSANHNTYNTDLSPIANTFNKSSSLLLPDATKKVSFSNKSRRSTSDQYQRKSSEKKSKQKRRIINDNNIPLTLATSLHSNVSFYNEDYFLTKYIHPLFTDEHYLR